MGVLGGRKRKLVPTHRRNSLLGKVQRQPSKLDLFPHLPSYLFNYTYSRFIESLFIVIWIVLAAENTALNKVLRELTVLFKGKTYLYV